MTINELSQEIYNDLTKVSAARHNTLGVPGFKTEMEHLRVAAAQLREVEDKWMGILHDFTAEHWIELCIHLVHMKVFECQLLAYELLWKNKNALNSLGYDQILQLGGILDNWASVDAYCLMIIGWHWREGTLPDQQILKWLKSEDHWIRRVAVVSTVPLNLKSRGGKGDTKRTLMVCENVVTDRNDKIVKSLSWALRELSKTDKTAVENFIEKYRESLHPRVIREVNLKLTTGRKNG